MKQQSNPRHTEDLHNLLGTEQPGVEEQLRRILHELHPADIGDVLEAIPPEQRRRVCAHLDPELMGQVLVEVPETLRADLVQWLQDDALIVATRALDPDDIADLLPLLSDEVVSRILFAMDLQERQRLDTLLAYPEDTAGGLMNVDTTTVRDDVSLEVVLRYLRRLGELPPDTNELFVSDRSGQLAGTLQVAKLLTLEPEQRVSDVMEHEPIKFDVLTPDKEVAAAFERYNLITAPVVDDANRVLGRITVDDVVDVIREEADHSVLAPAGLREDEDLFAPVARSTRNRAVWLGVNLATALLASWVIGQFEATIEKIVALAVLMPIVASMGGNAGTQTVTLVIRGLALGTITDSNMRRVLINELLISVLNSFIWALVVGVIAVAWYQMPMLGVVIAMAMMMNLVVAALSGVLIPIAVRKLGIDPALASGVALTTVTDVVGFLSFLGLAALLLL
ncbi:MAG: magnesium transporter [Gammaproteobacteria bacterium]|nr:MAG: magnesium transporter [Gammaproteobacteria bacterium]